MLVAILEAVGRPAVHGGRPTDDVYRSFKHNGETAGSGARATSAAPSRACLRCPATDRGHPAERQRGPEPAGGALDRDGEPADRSGLGCRRGRSACAGFSGVRPCTSRWSTNRSRRPSLPGADPGGDLRAGATGAVFPEAVITPYGMPQVNLERGVDFFAHLLQRVMRAGAAGAAGTVSGMLDSISVRSASGASGHSAGSGETPGGALPEPPALPYRSELLTAVADWVHQWNSPQFTIDIVVRVDPRLSVPGSRVLTRLFTQGPLRPSDLAEQLNTGASNVSKLLAQLETLGYIERSPDATDARVVRVQLTEEGRDAARSVVAGADEAIEHMLRDWTEDEIRSYTEQTRRLSAAGRDYVRKLRSEAAEG